MNNLKKNKKKVFTVITVGSTQDFFQRGKKIAKLLDKKVSFSPQRVISFEDTNDMVKFLTVNKLQLMAEIRKQSNSVSNLAQALHRSRAAVDKDIKDLESIGVIKSEYVSNPGHGRCKWVMVTDKNPIRLQVQATL